MNNTIQIQSRAESYEALATALGHVVLKLFKAKANILIGMLALIWLMSYLFSGLHPVRTALVCMVWALHMAITLAIDIRKGGERL